ncbi:MAG: succinyl-diaminopimelate desuccinylase [Parvibaculaceae bacterium]
MTAPSSAEILKSLVRCPSVTPAEAGALTVLEDLLRPEGFVCHRLRFAQAGTPDVENLFARLGQGGPHLCFAGHTDVVPPGADALWSHPPFAAEVEDGVLYGRGACDMKGSVAAFAAAAIGFARRHGGKLPGSVSLLITGDEESVAINGTVKVLQWLKEQGQVPDHCLVGEPTCPEVLGDAVKIGRRGSIHFEVTATGVQGHSAYPHKADNPIPRLARLIDRVAAARLDEGSAHFDPSTLAVTGFDVGNPAHNVIPAKAVARFNIRFNDRHDAESLKAWVRGQCAAVEREMGGTFAVATVEGADCFLTEPGPLVDVVVEAVQVETGVRPALSTSGGTSDARFVKDYCPVVEFGPVNQTIHQADERIPLAELEALTRIYGRVIEGYFTKIRP